MSYNSLRRKISDIRSRLEGIQRELVGQEDAMRGRHQGTMDNGRPGELRSTREAWRFKELAKEDRFCRANLDKLLVEEELFWAQCGSKSGWTWGIVTPGIFIK